MVVCVSKRNVESLRLSQIKGPEKHDINNEQDDLSSVQRIVVAEFFAAAL